MPVQDLDAPAVVVVNFGSAEEFRARPQYRDGVVVRGASPAKILGSYRLPKPQRCGVKDCGAMHDHGYLVRMPDGQETNTGWDCGLDHFGHAFLLLRQVYDRTEREHLHRQTLRQRVAEVAGIRQRVRELQVRRHGGEWLLHNLRLFGKHYPRVVLDVLREHTLHGQVAVFGVPPDQDGNGNGAPETAVNGDSHAPIRGSRAVIVGLVIFKLDVDHWSWHDLERRLDEFLEADLEHVAFDDVRRWEIWLNGLETELTQFHEFLEEGKKFFTRRNLDLLPYLVQDGELQEQLMWMVVDKDAYEPSPPPPEKPSVLKRLLMGLNS